jgi:hypothetical protein
LGFSSTASAGHHSLALVLLALLPWKLFLHES